MSDAIDEALKQARERRRLPTPAERRRLRQRAGLSQVDLASVLGVSHGTLSRWETGDRAPRRGYVEKYLGALDRLAEELGKR